MDQRVLDPITRMKPQRGRRLDSPAPVVFATAPARSQGVRWRLLVFTVAASAVAAAICVTVASFVA